uniref:RB1-inducible coiled-coil protein 1 n=1 Tax=Phallusia mammillata TaxID=59560 RepID=A0A6F9DPT7_9ASCI|nr:RB1-inducible coiled-coil protein 1 [Phallusia mammillata]
MLHVFSVTGGHMMTFDVALAMERVADLKLAVASSSSSSADKQVMLINGGQALEDDAKVCTYAAGTETNPIYVFDKSSIERPVISSRSQALFACDFGGEIQSALHLPPSYATIITRTQLAIRIHEATAQQVTKMKLLVQDEHLMFQGWQAAIANLSDTVDGFELRINTMREQCLTLLEDAQKYPRILEGLEDVVQSLRNIPMLPALKDGSTKGTSLLDWIELKCRKVKLGAMLNECRQRCQLLTKDKFEQMCRDCHKVSEQARNNRMKDISGIGERLVALDQVIIAAKQQVKEQRGIAQGFMKNQERARELQESAMNRDTLLTFCESHFTQLQIMRDNELATREAMTKCDSAKLELAQNLHTRLRWLYFVQRSILNADVKISMFREQLSQLHHQVEFLTQVKQAPTVYFHYLIECVRRKTFSHTFHQWTNKVLTSSKVNRDKEIVRRKQFKSQVGNHFVQQLFPGFSDRPPLMAKRPLREFDLEIPNVSSEELSFLQDFPEFNLDKSDGMTSLDLLPDPTQLSWQLVCSTSVKTTLSMQSSLQTTAQSTSVMSQDSSVVSQSTSFIKPPAESPSIFESLKTERKFQPGGFVVSSMQEMVSGDRDGLKNFSPPHLSPPSPGELIEIGSPDSGEFYSLKPFSLSPPDATNFTSNMLSIPEEMSESSRSKEQSTMASSDDEMFHSFTNETEREKMMQKLQALEDEKMCQATEFQTVIRKLQESITSLEQSREKVVSEFDRRWAESRAELENVFGQLESERQERKQAWEKGNQLTKEVEELKSKCTALSEENNSLKTDLTSKVQLVSEIDTESKKRHNSIQIELAHIQENAEREVWEVKQTSEVERLNLEKRVEALERDIELKNIQLSDADDRVQDLESEIFNTESKISEITTASSAKDEKIKNLNEMLLKSKESQTAAENEYVTLQSQVVELESKMQKNNEKAESLKQMMAAYEVELNDKHENEKLLKRTQNLLNEEQFKNEQYQMELESAQKRVQDLELAVEILSNDLSSERTNLKQCNENHGTRIQEIQDEYDVKIKAIETSHAEAIEKVGNENNSFIEKLEQDHKKEVQDITEKFNSDLEELKLINRRELDEMEADRLDAVVSVQRKLDELQEDYNQQTEFHQNRVEQLKTAHDEEIHRYQQDLDNLANECHQLRQDLNEVTSQQSKMMTSSLVSSSGEKESKRTKMDDSAMQTGPESSMLISMIDHKMSLEQAQKEFELQKSVLQTSFKKKEEDSARRRQMVFNSAIQRVTAAKDAEIDRLKEKLTIVDQSDVSSSTIVTQTESAESIGPHRSRENNKITVSNFQPGDLVFVLYDAQYCHHVVYTTGHTLHFVHSDSMTELSLNQQDDQPRSCVLAKFIEKEYCQAKKPTNRFKVPVGTKFYRVKLKTHKK